MYHTCRGGSGVLAEGKSKRCPLAMQDVDPDLQPISQLWRHTLDPVGGTMQAEQVSARAMEYPVINSDLSGRLQTCREMLRHRNDGH